MQRFLSMMYRLRVVLMCLACLIGKIQTEIIEEDECGNNFLKSLKEANFDIPQQNGTLGVTLKLKYLSKEGESQTATIKLSDYCTESKIICEGEKFEINGEIREGPLLHCSWKWKPEDSMRNNVEIRLTDKIGEVQAVSVVGRLSKEEESVFPGAAIAGPLDFKIVTANGSGVLRRRRRSEKVSGDRKRKKKANGKFQKASQTK